MNDFAWLSHYPEHIDWHAPLRICPLHELLDSSAKRFPENIALDFKGKLYSYRELKMKVDSFARGLHELGIGKGSKVGLFMPNCPQFVIGFFAALKAGATVVNYNPLYSQRELEHQIKDSGTELMITLNLTLLYPKLQEFIGTTTVQKVIVGNFPSVLPAAKAALYTLAKAKDIARVPKDSFHHSFMELLGFPAEISPPRIDPEKDVAVLQYTGGTTGVPKGVVLTHANLSANVSQCQKWFYKAREGDETIMGVLPFFHVFAMSVIMNFGIASGFKIIMHPRFELKSLLEDIAKKKPALMPGVPTMFSAIVQHKMLHKYDLTSLKMCISGGGPLPVEVKQQFEKLTGCKLVEGYGLSESSPVVSCNPLFGVNKEGSIGVPFPGTIMEVVDPDDKITPKAIGEVGEICIRGPQVMPGYWQKPEETANVLKPVPKKASVIDFVKSKFSSSAASDKEMRLYTGDLGYMDAEGYFFIVDRLKEMIISGGYNIYPRNIEEVLYSHPNIVEAAVIGIAHPTRGQVPKAFIVKKEGTSLTADEVETYLKERLSAYSVPHTYEFRDTLPKSMIGKILKKELK